MQGYFAESLLNNCITQPLTVQLAEARALSENVASVKAAEVKVASLTSRRPLDNSAVILDLRAASCSDVTTNVKLLTLYIAENPKSSQIKVTMRLPFCCDPHEFSAGAGSLHCQCVCDLH